MFNVLFLCTGNSARSILAEAYLNSVGKSRFKAYSAGSRPVGRVHPNALELLQRKGIDCTGLHSKSWDEFGASSAQHMDFIFTVCDNAAAETCPYWSGRPATAHWGIADPATVTGSDAQKRAAFEAAFSELSSRIDAFLATQRGRAGAHPAR